MTQQQQQRSHDEEVAAGIQSVVDNLNTLLAFAHESGLEATIDSLTDIGTAGYKKPPKIIVTLFRRIRTPPPPAPAGVAAAIAAAP